MIAAFYYLRIVKVMYIDEPGEAYAPSGSRIEGGLIVLSAAFVSPLGWIILAPLGVATAAAAKALF